MTRTAMFHTVLVANRGEIARRVIRTLRALSIRSVAVYSDGDADAPHVREADVAVRLGPDPASQSYLRIEAVIEAARRTGAQAVHPGYGFLSENLAFASACAEHGIVFIGPGERAIEIMGDKTRSREHAASHGVPVAPGFSADGLSDDAVAARAEEVGYPLLVKPSAGGGGKGMEVVRGAGDLAQALASARRVAAAAFGDDSLLLERLIERPRHIEVQVFGDAHGAAVALGERECTLQRRHQKVVEEAPSAGLEPGTRQRLLDAAVAAARSVDYVGAGTVEFLVDADRPDEFFFIEMNTRLQVEHPVTEEVTGLDLVELQLRVAAGEPLPSPGATRAPGGHAVEARVYAEAPERGFLPSVGRVIRFDAPAGVRVDAAIETGSEVSASYDPMIAKVIAHGPDRATALERLDEALARTVVLGVETNIAFLRALVQHERVRAGDLDTGLIETMLPFEARPPSDAMLAAAAAEHVRAERSAAPPHVSAPWASLPGWRLGGAAAPARPIAFLTDDGEEVVASETLAAVGHRPERPLDGSPDGQAGDAAGVAIRARVATARDADGAIWAGEDGRSVRLRPLTGRERLQRRLAAADPRAAAHGPDCRAPMPGAVVALHVVDGDEVRAGDRLVSIEAMKMEHPVLAPHDGVVALLVGLGEQVKRDQPVASVAAAPADAEPTEEEER